MKRGSLIVLLPARLATVRITMMQELGALEVLSHSALVLKSDWWMELTFMKEE